jgi:hypothetical protein
MESTVLKLHLLLDGVVHDDYRLCNCTLDKVVSFLSFDDNLYAGLKKKSRRGNSEGNSRQDNCG